MLWQCLALNASFGFLPPTTTGSTTSGAPTGPFNTRPSRRPKRWLASSDSPSPHGWSHRAGPHQKVALYLLGGLILDLWPRPALATMLWAAAKVSPNESRNLILRTRPEQNLAVLSTPSSHVTDALLKVQELSLGQHTDPVSADLAAPDDLCKGNVPELEPVPIPIPLLVNFIKHPGEAPCYPGITGVPINLQRGTLRQAINYHPYHGKSATTGFGNQQSQGGISGDGYKVVFSSQGGLDLTTLKPRYPLATLMQAAERTDSSTLTLRIHPVNNTCTVSAVNQEDALKLVQLHQLTYEEHEFAMTAYIAPPDGSVRGVITNAYWK
ncbi:hypothetical protein HPB51_025480 [Rhipicephalus microplus]|uniref:Uncharacterized protein n=1 Tax=Rhipicephalus microplus TaxID=6941 RepID=A0A9J6DRF9_RHIMP|nr:hypothetical protein HPB51_025480 [Rhipicephalus microplus]